MLTVSCLLLSSPFLSTAHRTRIPTLSLAQVRGLISLDTGGVSAEFALKLPLFFVYAGIMGCDKAEWKWIFSWVGPSADLDIASVAMISSALSFYPCGAASMAGQKELNRVWVTFIAVHVCPRRRERVWVELLMLKFCIEII